MADGKTSGRSRSGCGLPEALPELFRMSPEPTVILDGTGAVVSCNDAACELFGYSLKGIRSLKPLALFSDNSRRRLPELLQEENLSGGITVKLELVRKNGTAFMAEVVSRLIETGGTQYRWVIVREITEPLSDTFTVSEDEDVIGELTEFLPEITNEPEMMIETDRTGRIIRANKPFRDKTGYTPQDIKRGIDLPDLALPEDHERLMSDYRHIFGGGKVEATEYSLVKKDGSLLPVIVSATRLMKKRKVRGLRIVGLDITMHKNMEHELLIMEKLRALGELAGGVVHDFNNILAIILGYTEIHPSECTSDRCQDIISKINRTARDGAELIKRLRNITHAPDPGDLAEVNLNEIVEDVIELLEPKWRDEAERNEKTIVIENRLTDTPPVLGNAAELREVVSNFILNAIDAIEKDGTITVSSGFSDDYVTLDIIDTGRGMAQDIKDRMFDPFFTTKKGRGTGLGMSVSYSIINKLGGDITVESEEGKGTSISIHLSRSGEPSPAPVSKPSRASDIRHTILVIDDEENICEILHEYLSADGHSVTSANSAEAGLDMFLEQRHSIIITDQNMPGLSGWELARKIKNISAGTVIIMLSGWSAEVEERNKSEHVVDRFLPKPIDFTVLSAFLKSVEVV